jgi:Na+/H+ antiporter NhaD/arsenite permease-like protein
MSRILAQITNPALQGELTSAEAAKSGTSFANYFASLWSAVLAIGAIATLVLFIWGAMEWIASAGDKSKVEQARNRITQAVLGLVILVGAFVILNFLSGLLFGKDFSILQPKFPNVLGS